MPQVDVAGDVQHIIAGLSHAHLEDRDKQHPQWLWRSLGLYRENKAEHYDCKRDLEEVYEVIETWLTDSEVKDS